MPGKGFLIRGTLAPNMGSIATSSSGVGTRVAPHVSNVPITPVVTKLPYSGRSNRIPPSISIGKGSGKRG